MRRAPAIALAAVLLSPVAAFAGADVTVEQLISDSSSYAEADEISVRGELVGDFQERSQATWVQLNGDDYVDAPLAAGGEHAGPNLGVAVRIPNEVFRSSGVSTPGGYRVRGPIVRIHGRWMDHDPARGGESYLDAHSVVLLEGEQTLSDSVRWWAVLIGLSLAAGGIVPLLWRRTRG
jgi:hypothetical protein